MQKFEEIYKKLNKQQREAVDTIDGPLLVVAGAGTGKTTVIVERIVRIVNKGVDPRSILALTFTEKAAGEMFDRVNAHQSSVGLDITIATYNGFGDELLKRYAPEIGLGNLRLLGETGQLVFMREHLDEFKLDYFAPVSSPDSQLKLLANYVSLLKQQLVSAEAYIMHAKNMPTNSDEETLEKQKHQELADFYKTYLDLTRKNHLIDYDDQLFLTIELLNKRPNIKKQLQERYKYILVDEFQDTNPMQSKLLDLLAGNSQNIMVVGDDDQSIYGWRGATLANILDFQVRYPKTSLVALTENYRSTQSILDSAYRLIQNNNPNRLEITNNFNKKLQSHLGNGKSPEIAHFSILESELTWVAKDIAKRLEDGQDPGSIAVLARRTHGVQKAHEALELSGVPHVVAGLSNDLYRQVTVNHVLEALKAVNDQSDNVAVFHTLSSPLFSLPVVELSVASARARKEHMALCDVLLEKGSPEAKKAIKQLKTWHESTSHQSVGQLAYVIITDTGWKHELYTSATESIEAERQMQALSQYFNTLKEFERISGVASLQNYVSNLEALRAAGSEVQDPTLEISDSQINVLSIHRSKGLEWDTVYIIDCTEGSFPMRQFGGSLQVPKELATVSAADDHMSEERRLMYVAATRAKKELILSFADTHGGSGKRKASRFISEMLDIQDDSPLISDAKEQVGLELFAPDSSLSDATLPKSMIGKDNKLILSVSQIATWLRCPMDFYYQYVLQVPLPLDPTLIHGTIIHSCIQKIHESMQSGKVIELDSLLEYAKQSLPQVGYVTAGSRERAHKLTEQSVKSIYKRFISEAAPVDVEKPFRVELPDSHLIITGRIDATYALPGEGLEIRDYKTGTTVKTPEKAKSRATSSQQLALYALAWQLQHDELPALLTLDFVETNLQGSVKKLQKSIDTLTSKLHTMVSQLEEGEYPEGSDHTFCKHPL